MSDLEMLLRDVRPAPDPIWAARLDARAAAGFPGPPPRWKAPLLAFRNHLFAFGAVGAVASMLIVLVFAATQIEVGGDDEGASSGGASAPAMSAPESVDQAARGADRAVLKNASITLSTRPDQVQEIADRAIRIVDTLGGYVQSSTIDTAGSRGSAELSLRIPAAKLDSGMAQISKLAPVRSRSQQAEDVTDQREALEARVRDARADRAGLRVRLGKATTDRERARLRAQLDRASRRVTQRQRALAELGREVSYAHRRPVDRGPPRLGRRRPRRPLDARRRAQGRRPRARGDRGRARDRARDRAPAGDPGRPGDPRGAPHAPASARARTRLGLTARVLAVKEW